MGIPRSGVSVERRMLGGKPPDAPEERWRRSSKKLLLQVVVAQAFPGYRKRQRTAAVQKLARLRSGLANAKRLGLRQSSGALGARATFLQDADVSSIGSLLEESVGAAETPLRRFHGERTRLACRCRRLGDDSPRSRRGNEAGSCGAAETPLRACHRPPHRWKGHLALSRSVQRSTPLKSTPSRGD